MTLQDKQRYASERRFLGRSVMVSAGIKVSSAGLTFLMFLFLARALGAEAYGHFATMFSLGSFLAFVILMGQHTRVIKRLSAWIDDGSSDLVRSLLLQAVGSVVAAAVFLCALLGAAVVLLRSVGEAGASDIVLGTIPFILPFALSELCAAMLRAQGAIALALLPRDIIWRAMVVALAIAGSPVYLNGADARTTMFVISALLFVLTIAQGVLVARRLPRDTWSRDTADLPRRFWEDSSWLWAASLVGIMAGHLSVVFTSMNLSAAETGAFFAASKIALLLQLPMVAVALVAGPMFAKGYARSDMGYLQQTCRTVSPVLAATSVAGLLVICAAPRQVLSLFDPSFTVAAPALIVLAVTQLVSAFCGLGTLMMVMTDKERPQTYMIGLSEVLGLMLIFVLAPALGLMGAAIATLIGRSLGRIAASVYCYKRFGIDTTVFCLLRQR